MSDKLFKMKRKSGGEIIAVPPKIILIKGQLAQRNVPLVRELTGAGWSTTVYVELAVI